MGVRLMADFGDYLRYELGRRDSTVKQYLWRLGYLERLAGKPIEQVNPDDLRTIKRQWRYASETLKGLIVAAHQFHAWGALDGRWEQNGIMLVRTPQVISDSSPPLTLNQARAIMDACEHPYEIRLVWLGFYAGTRIGEAAAMDDRQWRGDVLRGFGLKSKTKRQVPVHSELAKRRDKMLSTRPPHVGTLQKRKEHLEERTGIEFVAHQLRKTFATLLQDAGIEEKVIMDLLGHSGSVTRRYAPVTPRMRQRAISSLDYERGSK